MRLLTRFCMKLLAHIGESLHNIEIRRDGGKVFAKIDDREYELEASEPETNVFLLKHAGQIHEFYVAPAAQPGAPQIVSSRKADIEISLIDPKRLRGSGIAASADGLGCVASQVTAMARTTMIDQRIRLSMGRTI